MLLPEELKTRRKKVKLLGTEWESVHSQVNLGWRENLLGGLKEDDARGYFDFWGSSTEKTERISNTL